jgi:hypothetical protein
MSQSTTGPMAATDSRRESDVPTATDRANAVEHEPIDHTPPLRRAVLRVATDADGRSWRVFEREAPEAMSGEAPVRCLYFDSDVAVRRVHDYPAGWATLPDDELLRVSWHR